MAPARRVRGIKPKASLSENGVRIIRTRLEELLSWRPYVKDPERITELHNMRISAKRLRYAVEVFVLCFPKLKPVLDDLTDIQESLGSIHDLDVLSDLLRQRLRMLDAQVQEEALNVSSHAESRRQRADQLRGVLYASARNPQRLGLLGLLVEKVGERQTRHEEFILRWDGPGLDLLAETIEHALSPGISSPSDPPT